MHAVLSTLPARLVSARLAFVRLYFCPHPQRPRRIVHLALLLRLRPLRLLLLLLLLVTLLLLRLRLRLRLWLWLWLSGGAGGVCAQCLGKTMTDHFKNAEKNLASGKVRDS